MSKEKQTKYGSICEIRKEHKIIDIVKERDIKGAEKLKKRYRETEYLRKNQLILEMKRNV